MTLSDAIRLDRAIDDLPRSYPGPGGAVAVLRDGKVLIRHAWGWANAERRIPFTPRTLFRMCSITKQFTCALLLDLFPDPSVLDGDVAACLPSLKQPAPKVLHLSHNQSGLRDYWAIAMLLGSPVEAPFGDTESKLIFDMTKTLQFQPGTRSSYVNQNFRILSDILQNRTNRGFGELLSSRLFDRAGMESAILAADTRAMPDGTEGYEGTQASGFRAAGNRIIWTGDAGLGASLDDMIAWEKHIDATRDDPGSLYQRMARPVRFADGARAHYAFGLRQDTAFGRFLTGHGGALRGWRSHRLYVPSDRLSIVVMFNHLSNAYAAATDVLAAALGEFHRGPDATQPIPEWQGSYIESETGLSVRIERAGPGQIRLRYDHSPELLDVRMADPDRTRLRTADDGLWMDRPDENQSTRLQPNDGALSRDISGRYHCSELNGMLTVADAGGVLYGGFSGALGQGRMELLDPVGIDTWALPCPRALDHTPPGDWTLAFHRDGRGRPDSVMVGCWLARGLVYQRVG